jgi:hypothetical protein
MKAILEILSAVSTLVGTFALYVFLINSFTKTTNEKKPRPVELEKIIYQKSLYFIISLIVCEFLGIFFLLLSGSLKHDIVTFNGFAFLVASSLCSVITIVNAVRSHRINFPFRLGIQFGTLFFALLFIRISIDVPDLQALEQMSGKVSLLLQFFAAFYFATSVLAVVLILWDALKLEIEFLRIYLIWVLIIGVTVGTGLFVASNNWRELLI